MVRNPDDQKYGSSKNKTYKYQEEIKTKSDDFLLAGDLPLQPFNNVGVFVRLVTI